MWLYRVGKGEAGSQVPPLLSGLKVGNHEVFLGSKAYHVAVREDDGARYILAYDVEEYESRLSNLMLITVLASVAIGLFTLLAGYLLAGKLTGRLERLAARVEAETPGPLAEAGMERELLAVAEALDNYRERQGLMLERERAFVANLSHELRTPLTGIRTDAEMLTALPNASEAVVRRGNRIVSSVDRINGLANSLLLLAREAKPALPEEISLPTAIGSVWESLQLIAPKAVGLHLEIPEGTAVNADPTLLELVLRNVLDNALRYSETGQVICRLDGSCLAVIDSGPGFAEDELERVFDRFFAGPGGVNGLGLALVRHVCTASGWQVGAANVPGGGGQISVDFGPGLIRH
jgi:signal transduction histidine kinase